MDQSTRAVIGFAVAPLVPPLAYWASGSIRNVDSLGASVLVGAPLAYAWTIGIGLPAYRLITRHATLRWWHVLGIATTVGFLAGSIHRLWPPAGAVLGLSAGITFWLIWYRRSDARART
jgi:hypothetical protein